MRGEFQNSLDAIAGTLRPADSMPMVCKQLGHSRKTAKNLRFLCIVGILLAAVATSKVTSSQTPNTQSSSKRVINSDGKKLFEAQCAACHGLDGGGGEHAPDIARASSVKSRSESELFYIIHDGLILNGMPSFSTISDDKIRAILAHLRLLQGKTATRAAGGDRVRGKELFGGKGRCADCHAISGYGRFVAADLTDFAANHDANEIRDAILHPRQADGPAPAAAVVTTTAGDRFSGMIRNENNSSLQIQDAEGRFYFFVKYSLRSIDRSTAPCMPANYQLDLSATEIEDLVSYIAHQALTPKVASGQSAGRPQAQFE